MNSSCLNRIQQWFDSYVAGFQTEDVSVGSAIQLKKDHTRRVCREIVDLGQSLNLSEGDLRLAEAMALLHDVGRFRQFEIYGTFDDKRSENHALLGVRVLALDRVLRGCPHDEKRLITRAIAFHNAFELPSAEDQRTLFFMRLLRDADKLDIWRVVLEQYQKGSQSMKNVIAMGLPDIDTVAPAVFQALDNQRLVRIEDVRTLTDLKLLCMSWVFDLNFRPSLEAVRTRGYVEQIAAALPDSSEIQQVLKRVLDYLRNPVGLHEPPGV